MKIVLNGVHQAVSKIHDNLDHFLPGWYENAVVLQLSEREGCPYRVTQDWLGTCTGAECAADETHGCDHSVNRRFEVVIDRKVHGRIGREARSEEHTSELQS